MDTIVLVEEVLISVLVIVLIVMPFAATAATVGLWRLYFMDRRRPRSWVLFAMAFASSIVSFAGFPLALLAIRRLADFSPLDPRLTVLILGSMIAMLESVPLYFWFTIERQKRSKRPLVDIDTASTMETNLNRRGDDKDG